MKCTHNMLYKTILHAKKVTCFYRNNKENNKKLIHAAYL